MSPARVLALGLCTGVLVLVKSYALLVLLAAAFVAWKRRFALAGLYLVTVVAVVLPWSVYATRHGDRVVVISTQLDNILLDGNNEDAIRTGTFAPGWRKWNAGDPRYLYNRIAEDDLSAVAKVGLFYRDHWTRVPELFARKLVAAVGGSAVVAVTLALFVLYCAVAPVRIRRRGRAGPAGEDRIPLFPIMCAAVWLSNTLVAFGLLRYTLVFLPFMAIVAARAPVLAWREWKERREATAT
jgi:hypothetical protein